MASNVAKVHSCHFPAAGRQVNGPKRPLSVRVELQHLDLLQKLLEKDDVSESLSAVIRAAWALTLRCYTGLNDVCFGFEEVGGSSNRSASESTGDDLTSELAAIMHIDEHMTLSELVQQAGSDESIVAGANVNSLQFNTSMLVRCGTATTGAKPLPSKASIMSDKV